jgi:hypothetical protein
MAEYQFCDDNLPLGNPKKGFYDFYKGFFD